MPTAENKIQFGLKNCYYAVLTESNGTITYGTPKAFPGAVNLNLSANGSTVKFPADDITYWQGETNSGYSGSFEVARVVNDFVNDVLNFQADDNGVICEYSNILSKPFALLFEVNGDETATKYCLYNCVVARPTLDFSSIGGDQETEPKTQTLDITISPRPDNALVKSYATKEMTPYATWTSAVYSPTFTE